MADGSLISTAVCSIHEVGAQHEEHHQLQHEVEQRGEVRFTPLSTAVTHSRDQRSEINRSAVYRLGWRRAGGVAVVPPAPGVGVVAGFFEVVVHLRQQGRRQCARRPSSHA